MSQDAALRSHGVLLVASLILAAEPDTWAVAAETRPVLPLAQGLYTDGNVCGAAEIRQNKLWNGFSIPEVLGGTCELKAVTKHGDAYAFEAACSEGNGAAYHSWRARGTVRIIEGASGFAFHGTTYRSCSADDVRGTGILHHRAADHLPLIAGSYRTGAGQCGALVYQDNPKAHLAATFGGPDFGGDTCTVARAAQQGQTVEFAATCIPSRSGATMRIGVPTTIDVVSPERFRYVGKFYSLCEKITY